MRLRGRVSPITVGARGADEFALELRDATVCTAGAPPLLRRIFRNNTRAARRGEQFGTMMIFCSFWPRCVFLVDFFFFSGKSKVQWFFFAW